MSKFKLTIEEDLPGPRGTTEKQIFEVLGAYAPGAKLIIETPGCKQSWQIIEED